MSPSHVVSSQRHSLVQKHKILSDKKKKLSKRFQLIPMVNGRLSPIMVHFRPIMGIRSPVKKPPSIAPTGNKDPIQLPVSSVKATGSVQFCPSKSGIAPPGLQLVKNGSAGEVQAKPVPRPNAPKLAILNKK
jgi:hypothetical protein